MNTEQHRTAMAAKAVADLIDCLDGIVAEQGYEGLANYTADPERLLAEAEGAREFLAGLAGDDGESDPARGGQHVERGVLVLPGRCLRWCRTVSREATGKPKPTKARKAHRGAGGARPKPTEG